MASGTLLTEQDMKDFLAQYGGTIHDQCVSLMGDTQAARDLEEKVIFSVRAKYEYKPLPANCETMLIAQCCILSSWMEPQMENMTPGAGSGAAEPPEESAAAAADVKAPAAAADEKAPAEENAPPEESRKDRADAVLDPEKTELWLPGGAPAKNIKQFSEPEDAEGDTERSGAHSVVNTVLMIALLGSIVFFLWNTGILRWLKRMLEGIFAYG